jgi:hypothetical protein
MRVLKVMCVAAALVAMLASGARADEWNKKTFLTFSGPVQVPGVTLPAGTYTFKLADLSGNRHVVQIFDKAESKIYTTILAIPHQRLEPSDKPIVLFSERPAGSPVAVKAWFYPGETIGNEFVYPKSQAMAIAKSTHQSVLSTDSESTTESAMKTAEIARIDEHGHMHNEDGQAIGTTLPAHTAASSNAPAKNSTGNASAATSGQTASNASGRRSLPRTASSLPLLGLLSVLAIAGALGVRRVRETL